MGEMKHTAEAFLKAFIAEILDTGSETGDDCSGVCVEKISMEKSGNMKLDIYEEEGMIVADLIDPQEMN